MTFCMFLKGIYKQQKWMSLKTLFQIVQEKLNFHVH